MNLARVGRRPRFDRLVLLAIPLTASVVPGNAVAQGPSVEASMIVSAAWLRDHLEDPDVVVLQVDRTRDGYDRGHIPGARFVGYDRVITSRSGLRTELPTVDQLRELVESLGISTGSSVVIYGDLLPATRLYFTLDYLGHGDRTALLDGGIEAWRAAGGSVTPALPTIARGTYQPAPRPRVVVGIEEIQQQYQTGGMVLLDARSLDEYTGSRVEDDLPRGGHLPGARHLEWSTAVTNGRLASPETLGSLLREAGISSGTEIVTYCRVGTRASLVYFVARYLGFSTRLYDGSMEEWSGRADLPLVSGAQPGMTSPPH